MIRKVIPWMDVRVGDFVCLELNENIIRRVTRCEESAGRLFIYLRDVFPVASLEFHAQVGGAEHVLLVHRPWRDQNAERLHAGKITRLLMYLNSVSGSARGETLAQLGRSIEDYELGSPPECLKGLV